jgi:hypothetical protein
VPVEEFYKEAPESLSRPVSNYADTFIETFKMSYI